MSHDLPSLCKQAVETEAVAVLDELLQQRWQAQLQLVLPDTVLSCGATEPLLPPLMRSNLPSHPAIRSASGIEEVFAPIRLGDQDRPSGWVVARRRLDDNGEASVRQQLVDKVAEVISRFLRERHPRDNAAIKTLYDYSHIIGQSEPMQSLYQLLDKVIESDSTVLIEGENGTGKELIAKAIHFNSRRKTLPFVVQNCSAFNDNLLDSELFGHRKGAFTGAVSDKKGLFEVADGGTFFLDEIGDMSPSLQVKLLRVLQEGTFLPVGDTQLRRVDVRIIAATNRKLRSMMEAGEFREDLYYRINVINITPPTLRERRADIPLLVNHFLATQSQLRDQPIKTLTRECLQRLGDYRWPGNVRELENEIERLVVLAGQTESIAADRLSLRITQAAKPRDSGPGSCLPEAMTNLERKMIYEVLSRNQWNKTRAAKELRISRRNLIRKVHKYKLDPQQPPS